MKAFYFVGVSHHTAFELEEVGLNEPDTQRAIGVDTIRGKVPGNL